MNEHKRSVGMLLKRALIVCLCLVMTLGTTLTIMAASYDGDLDGDGKLTAFDAQILAEYQAGLRELDPAKVAGITIRGILDRVLGLIVDEPTLEEGVETTIKVTTDENGLVTEEVTLTKDTVTVTVPVGVAVTTNELVLSVQQQDTEDGSVNLEEGQEQLPVDIHIEGISAENTVPVIITITGALEAGMNQGNVALYHVENGEAVAMTQVATTAELDAHNEFYYDPATGDVTIATVSFSVFRFVSENAKQWKGGVDHSWYFGKSAPYTIANADQLWSFSQIVGGMTQDAEGNWLAADGNVIPGKSADPHQDSFYGKTVNLAVDINLNDLEEDGKIFYPIGYYNSEGTYEKSGVAITSGFYTFQGTFDGQGHTIANFYQNTWEMKGDHNWYDATAQNYRDGMGLFGKVYGGTVKNLTVENFSSDGEIATTGTIAAYADCGATFENIAIFNCNPRVYNIGNGGIVGCVGWYANETEDKTPVTFKNITVDNTNKISALWGSWDVACGGLVGQYYPTSGQTNATDNAGIHMENCHVAAQIDVNNDVCANYQYYAYRYAGILIGSIRENVIVDGHSYPNMDGITASGCTVHFGDWNDYYYCELVANSLASYTHDHQMSRLTQVKSVDVEKMTVTYLNSTTPVAIPESGTYNYVVVTGEHATENATCYHFVNGVQHLHESKGKETVDGVEVLVEDKQHLYLEFNNLFTGYGWGVTSKGITDFAADQITILDRTVADSVDKFVPAEGVENITIENGVAITLGQLFAAADSNVAIYTPALNVSVTDLAENDGVNTTVELDKTGDSWTDYKVTFHGIGNVEVTIQDYYYCAPTRINLTVSAHVHCLCGAETDLGDTCASCNSKAVIWDPNTGADLPANSAKGHYYLTGDISRPEGGIQYVNDVAICLNGKTVTSKTRCLEAETGATVSITDCDTSDEKGLITGSTHAALLAEAGGILNLYNGTIKGNHNQMSAGSGVVYLRKGTADNVAVFNMYGGKITENITNMRGAVFTDIPANAGDVAGTINILGGEITNNTSYALNDIQDPETKEYLPNNGKSGGAGIYSFGPVTIGGDAKIYGNTCTLEVSTKNENIYLRTSTENALYSGQLILDASLTEDARIDYGTYPVVTASDMEHISGKWIEGVVTYDGDPVLYADGKFYTEHIHCLCGKTTSLNTVCDSCDSTAVAWEAVYRLPHNNTEGGHYYLRADISKTHYANMHGNVDICLNGHEIDSNGNACLYVYDDATVSIADCTGNGKITGTTERATIVVTAGGTLKLYGGNITGNSNGVYENGEYAAEHLGHDSGIISLLSGIAAGGSDTTPDEGGSDVETPDEGVDGQNTTVEDTTTENTPAEDTTVTEARSGGKFYMYGGKIYGNTARRGAVFTHEPVAGTELAQIYILGGEITENTGTYGAQDARSGGAGIYSFVPVYVGGDAKIHGNICPGDVTHNWDIYLRNAEAYGGKLIVSGLTEGANINYGTGIAETQNPMKYIEGSQNTWDPEWIKYNGANVYHGSGKFYLQITSCMCGATTSGTCATCGTAAVVWTPWTETTSLPTSGNYYLTADVYPTSAAKIQDADVAINLNGRTVNGKDLTGRLFTVSAGTLSITDTATETGMITGCNNKETYGGVINIANGAAVNLYNGKIYENTNTYNGGTTTGLIYVSNGAAFTMYSGEITKNTVTRGAVMGEIPANGAAPTIRILGGAITGNTGTTTTASGGGTGVYAYSPVEVGGSAQIHTNTSAGSNNADIWLRNQDDYAGKLILSSEKPLVDGANINYGTAVAETAGEAMIYISFSGETTYALNGQVTYNGEAVTYNTETGVFSYGDNSGEDSSTVQPEDTTETTEAETTA